MSIVAPSVTTPPANVPAFRPISTPGVTTIDALTTSLKTGAQDLLKTLLLKDAAGNVVAVVMPGDRELNEPKLRKFLKTSDVKFAGEADFAAVSGDLPHAVIAAEVDLNSAGCYRDYVCIDDVLQLNMPLVRRRIADAYGAEMPLVQRWFGGFGDARTMRGFRRARKNSWALAQLLAQAQTPSARAGVERLIEERSEIEGRKIMGLRHAGPVWISVLQSHRRWPRLAQ